MLKNKKTPIKQELIDYLDFWMDQMIFGSPEKVFPEISIDNVPNKSGLMGSMYLSRILYGASKACETLKTKKYKELADVAFNGLADFKNPRGGYYWARKYNMEWVHDPENINMAQAFVLYGLVEYARINPSPSLDQLIDDQVKFILSVLSDDSKMGFLDGFDEQWQKGTNMTRSFGTHFHILEALVKYEAYKNDKSIKSTIADLIRIIIDKFIDQKNYNCIHRFGESWQVIPNEIWAGHNAECSWVLCEAAEAIKDQALIEETQNLAILMMDGVITFALDRNKGGYFNVLDKDPSSDKTKGWWQQAEVTLGLFNTFAITGQIRYKKLAVEQIAFIQDKFLCPEGEWYTEVTNEGTPAKGVPKVFFWKSVYHTVRYYDYLIKKLEA